MPFAPRHWARLHTQNLDDLWNRWRSNAQTFDPLTRKGRRPEPPCGIWVVKSELELVRLLGGLHWRNPQHTLWFRGEGGYHPKALPTRYRDGCNPKETKKGVRWLNKNAGVDTALRDRSPLARLALLQHYGCPTSFLDITLSYEVACAFAFEKQVEVAYLRVYALPRHTQSVSVFDDADVVLVDLRAEMPSYCLRPHVQQGGFLARREAAYCDIEGKKLANPKKASLDDLCIAHIELRIKDARGRFFEPRERTESLYPPASGSCRQCKALCGRCGNPGAHACGGPQGHHSHSDMNGDYILHLLTCLAGDGREGLFGGRGSFPDHYADPKPRT
jgi:hypothetical protein